MDIHGNTTAECKPLFKITEDSPWTPLEFIPGHIRDLKVVRYSLLSGLNHEVSAGI